MDTGYILLILICILAIYIIYLNLTVIGANHYKLLRNICIILFLFSTLRYITLIAYGDHLNLKALMGLRYFYFATSIGLTLPTASAVWYITPLYRQKIKYPTYILCFLPWIIFYLYLIIVQPTQIVQGANYGYILSLRDPFSLYLSIAQGSFITVMIILCIIGLVKYKNIQLRVQYIVLILAQIGLTLDGIGYYLGGDKLFPPFTITEALGFLAIYYVFKVPIIEIKGIQNAE